MKLSWSVFVYRCDIEEDEDGQYSLVSNFLGNPGTIIDDDMDGHDICVYECAYARLSLCLVIRCDRVSRVTGQTDSSGSSFRHSEYVGMVLFAEHNF